MGKKKKTLKNVKDVGVQRLTAALSEIHCAPVHSQGRRPPGPPGAALPASARVQGLDAGRSPSALVYALMNTFIPPAPRG